MENLSEWARPEIIWFVLGLVLLLMEFALPGLVIFFFGIGAWVVSALCFFSNISLNVQLLTFLLSSVLLLLFLRKRMKTIFSGFSSAKEDLGSDMHEFIGQTAVVKEEVKGRLKGRVELHGTDWDAIADEEIPPGATVEVIDKENITLKVKKI